MKIAYLINTYPKVSHSFIRREILALERQGLEILRIALRGWNEHLPDEVDRNERSRTRYVLDNAVSKLLFPTILFSFRSPARLIKAIMLALRMARKSSRSFWVHLIYVAEACCITQWVRQFGATRLHAHFGTNSAEIAMLVSALGGPPYSFTVHGPEEFFEEMDLKEKVHRSSFVVGVSMFGRSQLYLRCPYPDWPKIKVVHCGLEKSFYDIEALPPSAANRLLCVGRLCEAKGQLLLIEAVARIAAKGTSLELVLAGDGPMRNHIERLVTQLRLEKIVTITGWIGSDEVRRQILSARALVLPTFAEGLPVVIMEAMALGRPVISTYVAGIPELVQPVENGWLVPAGSIDDLIGAIEDCLSVPLAALQRMGESGRTRVLSRHAIDTEAAKLAQLFMLPAVPHEEGCSTT